MGGASRVRLLRVALAPSLVCDRCGVMGCGCDR